MSAYQKAYFLLSVADVKQLPADRGIEVAIIGRSNSGKSSTINCITQQKQLARVSKTPGRTQLLNVFPLDENRRLVDLPGYGYAKATGESVRRFTRAINEYLGVRQCLRGLILTMDIRHPLKASDVEILDFCQQRQLPVHILLNKCDKVSRGESINVLRQVQDALTVFSNSVTVQCFSSTKKTGLPELYQILNKWFEFKT